MELSVEHRQIIEEIVRKNPRLAGNEDLFEDFCSETMKRSLNVLSSINDVNNLEVYLNKISSSAILEVLRSSGRLKRINKKYQKINETPISPTGAYKLDEQGELIYDIPDDSANFEERIILQEDIQRIRDIIVQVDMCEKSKKYRDIYFLRYIKGLKQSEISKELAISQGEVSKRLIELINKIKELYNKN